MKNSRKIETKEVLQMVDAKNAERFFDRTGEELRECYEYYVDEKIGIPDVITSAQEIFLYIPESDNDMYTIYLN